MTKKEKTILIFALKVKILIRTVPTVETEIWFNFEYSNNRWVFIAKEQMDRKLLRGDIRGGGFLLNTRQEVDGSPPG